MPEIRTENLSKEYKDVIAVRDISITFPKATVTCLLGPSGCGKTTLMRLIAGLEEPTHGDVYFDSKRVTDLASSKRNIGMVFQYPVVYRGLNVYRNIELPLREDKLSERECHRRIDEVVEMMGLKDSLDKDITELDNNERQKVAVARAVARQPQILLFDEPLTNVDVETKAHLKQALKELTQRVKHTIIYVTHDQTEAMTLADQIALMKEGLIVQRDAPRDLYNHPDDIFGGWFLGNPGMNFVSIKVEIGEGYQKLNCPLFPKPLCISGAQKEQGVIIGIRPENIRVGIEQTQNAVPGTIIRKSIIVGGQYLLLIEVDEISIKAKVRHELGHQLHGEIWVEIPLEKITLFGKDGHRLEAEVSTKII